MCTFIQLTTLKNKHIYLLPTVEKMIWVLILKTIKGYNIPCCLNMEKIDKNLL